MKIKSKIKYIPMMALGMTVSVILPIFALTGKVTVNSLNVRESASMDAGVIDGLSLNQEIEILGEEGNFYKISIDGKTGYVSKDYVEKKEEAPEATTETPASQNTAPNTELSTNATTVGSKAVNKTETDIRILPVINGLSLGKLPIDKEVTIISQAGKWSYIETEAIAGWVYTNHLNGVVESTNNEELKPTEQEEKLPEQKQEETNFEEKTMYSTGSVNVRSGPSTNDSVVTSLIKGTDVIVKGESGDWYKVEVREASETHSGYVRKDLLSDTKPESTTSRSAEAGRTTDVTTYDTDLVSFAKNYIGCPYVYGGSGPSSFDCSGFTMFVYNNFGYSLPHTATGQANYGTPVSKENLQAGDLVFFLDYQTMDGIGHVGIYVGNGDFIHASSGSAYSVTISNLNSGSYANRYCGARGLM